MATEIDGLQISISADVSKAEKSIDNLINTLGKLQKSLVKTDIKETGISDMSDEFNGAEKAIIASSKNISRNISKAMLSSKNSFDSFMKSIANVGKNKTFNGFAGDLPKEISKMESKLDSLLAKEEKFKKLGQNVDSKGFRTLQYDLAETLNYLDNLYKTQEKSSNKKLLNFWETPEWKAKFEKEQEIKIDADTTEAETELNNFQKNVKQKLFANLPRYKLDTSGLDALMKSEPAQIAQTLSQAQNAAKPIEQTVNKLENASSVIKQFADLLKNAGFKEAANGIGQIGGAIGSITTGAKGASGALAGFSKAIPYIGAVVTILGVLGGAVTFTVKGIKGIASKMQNAFKKVSNTISNVVKSLLGLGSATDSTQTLLGKAFNRVFQTLKSGLISRAVTTTVNSIGDAFKELALYSQNIGTPFNKNISRIVADFKWLGRTIATVFEPIINVVTPVIDFLVSKLVSAINIINQFFNALTGGGTYTEAKYQVDDYATSVNGASAAQSKLNKQLNKLDELNVITKSDGSGSGGGAGGGGQPYETKPIEPNVSLLAQRLKEAWEKADFSWFGALFAGKLSGELDKIDWNTIKGTAEKVGKSLATLINGFITFPDMGTKIGNAIGEAINTFISGIDGFIGNLDWKSVGTFIGDMINGALNTVEWTKILDIANNLGKGLANAINGLTETEALSNCGKAIGSFIKSAVSSAWSFVTNLDFKQLGTEISKGINKAINEMATKDATGKTGWEKLAETLSEGFKGVLNTLSTALDGLDWKAIGTSVIQFITSIDWSGLFASATNLKTKLSKALWELFKLAVGAMQATTIDIVLDLAQSAQDFYNEKIQPIVNFVVGKALEIGLSIKGSAQEFYDNVLKPFLEKIPGLSTVLDIVGKITKTEDDVPKDEKKIGGFSSVISKFKDKITGGDKKLSPFTANVSKTKDKRKDSKYKRLSFMGNIGLDKNSFNGLKGLRAEIQAAFTSGESSYTFKDKNGKVHTIYKKDGGIFKNGRWHDIAQYASGGYPNSGQMFIAREAGPELVGRIGNSTAVLNNEQIVASVSAGVYQAVRSAMSETQPSSSNVVFEVQGDPNGIFKVVQKQSRNYTNRTGKPAFI